MSAKAIKLTYDNCRTSSADFNSLQELKNKTILITGGTGFVGKWLTEMVCYLNAEHKLNIKLYLLARDAESFKTEVPHLAKNSCVNLIQQDVRHLSELPKDVNYVINAAGSPDRMEHVSKPLSTIDTFYKGTNSVLEECFRLPGLHKIIHLSSNYVYGSLNNDKIKETDMGTLDCNSINATYGEVKRMTETLCAVYGNQQHLPIIIIRPFAFVGPYQKLEKPWAINNFIRDAIHGGPIKILGNGNTQRSYLYGSDLAFWLLKSLVKGRIDSVYNVGSTNSISLKDLAEGIKNIVDKKLEVIERSSKEVYGQTSKSTPDLRLITKDVQVKENYTLIEALEHTVNWNKLKKK